MTRPFYPYKRIKNAESFKNLLASRESFGREQLAVEEIFATRLPSANSFTHSPAPISRLPI
jgi:hypothetical protein